MHFHHFKRLVGALVGLSALLVVPASALGQSGPPSCDYRKWVSLSDVGYWPRPNSEFTYRFNVGTLPSNQPGTSIPYNSQRFAGRLLSGARTWRYGRNACRMYQDGGVQIYYGGTTSNRAANHEDGVNTIDLGRDVDIAAPYHDCSGQLVIACTGVRSANASNNNAPIREVDIRFNRRKRWWTGLRIPPVGAAGDPFDLWSVAAHEFGHAIGFGHNDEGPNASPAARAQVMFASIGPGGVRRYLRGGDYTGMCFVYLGC